MIPRRPVALAAAVGLAAAVAGCASAGQSDKTTQAPSRSATPSPSAPQVDRAKVAAAILAVGNSTTSESVMVSVTGEHRNDFLQGSRTLAGGKVTAFDLRLQGGGAISSRVVGVSGHTYGRIESARGTTGNKYVPISASSTNAEVRTFAMTLNDIVAPISFSAIASSVRASTSIRTSGSVPLGDSTSTTHYSLTPALAKLSAGDCPQRAKLIAAGRTTISVELYVDEKGRPVRIDTVAGSDTTTAEFRDYGKPVTIEAPN